MVAITQSFIASLSDKAEALAEAAPKATLLVMRICQGGGTVTQLPAEQYQSGSTPGLGFGKS